MFVPRGVPELSLGVSRFPTALPAGLTDPVCASKARARRRWAARTCIMLALTGTLLAGMLVWQRDTNVVYRSLEMAQRPADAVKAHLDKTGLLPASLPLAEPGQYSYASYADRFYTQQASRPVMIAISPAMPLLLRPNGRSVIIYDHGNIRAEWMNEGAFTRAYLAQSRDMERFEQQRRARPVVLPQ